MAGAMGMLRAAAGIYTGLGALLLTGVLLAHLSLRLERVGSAARK